MGVLTFVYVDRGAHGGGETARGREAGQGHARERAGLAAKTLTIVSGQPKLRLAA